MIIVILILKQIHGFQNTKN